MRISVKLYVSGKVFEEIVEAANYEDGKKTALARNPTAKVVSVTAVFR
jgi:hypothetical protein